MLTDTRLLTAEEFARMPARDARTELVGGEVVTMSLAGHKHGRIALRIGARLLRFVEQHNLGEVYAAETGFITSREPDTVRAPDAAFVVAERVAEQNAEGFFDGPPDLAVEVVSPTDRAPEVEQKVQDFLNAGSQQVWIVHPSTQTVTTYYANRSAAVLTLDDNIEGGSLLPGFSLPVAEIFR